MKRVIVSLMVGIGALLAACTEEAQPLPVAGLSGTYDVALVGDLLFVTSSDRDELRVLDLKERQEDRGYVRAPNPLEALSIPVLQRPQALTRDVLYSAQGEQGAGSYVYVRSNGSTEISVVAAGRDYLRELRRLSTNQLSASLPKPSTGPVTAFAARGPGADGLSTLYYATQESTGAQLWQVRLPGPEVLDPTTAVVPELLAEYPNVAVSSLLVLPQSGQLAIATRGAAGTVGWSLKVDLVAGTTQVLTFGGAQVLQLATHEALTYKKKVLTGKDSEGNNLYTDQDETLQAGARIFGVLDPSSCGVPSQCTGVLAVDTNTGTVLNDATGYPMLPIGLGSALPMGLSLSTDTQLAGVGSVALLGIVPLSNGQIVFFDGVTLLSLDMDPDRADTKQDPERPTQTEDATKISFVPVRGSIEDKPAEIEVTVTEGVTRTESYQLQYQGILPGMGSLSRGTGSSEFLVPAELVRQQGVLVQKDDVIVLLPAFVGGQPCGTDLVVSSEPVVAPDQSVILSTTTPIPDACTDYQLFQVRAAGSEPFVISSSSAAYLGRMGPGDTFSLTEPYFFHPYDPADPEDPATTYGGDAEDVAVSIKVVRARTIQRGDRYVVDTSSNYLPYFITVDTSFTSPLRFFQLPGPVVHAEVGDKDYAYIAYPSADGVLEADLEGLFVGVANSRALFPYR